MPNQIDIGAIQSVTGLDIGAIEYAQPADYTYSLSDSISLSDASSVDSGGVAENISGDSYSLGDVVSPFWGGGQSDTLAIYDEIAYTITYSGVSPFPTELSVSDTLVLGDLLSFSTHGDANVLIGDSIVLNDGQNNLATHGLVIGDTLSISDILASLYPLDLAVNDTLSFSDIAGEGSSGPQWFFDALVLVDFAQYLLEDVPPTPIDILITDELLFGDGFQPDVPGEFSGLSDVLLLIDLVKINEMSIRDGYLRRYLNDVILISTDDGTLTSGGGLRIGVADTVAVADEVGRG